MNGCTKRTNWDNIVQNKELQKAAELQKNPFYEKKDYTSAKEDIVDLAEQLPQADLPERQRPADVLRHQFG